MRRGTTPIHTFTLPVDMADVAKLRVAYAQQGRIVFVKTEADATHRGNVVQFKLTQADTLSFRCNRDVEIQIKALTHAGEVLISQIMRVEVGRCLDDEVMA